MFPNPIRRFATFATFFVLAQAAAFAGKATHGKGASVIADDSLSVAIFAGGSFWCLEAAFEKIPGVVAAVSGYTGGQQPNPTYDQVSEGKTGHVEAVEVRYNSKTVGYAKLLDAFWRNIDPTRADGQFSDAGPQFRTVVYYRDESQKRLALASKRRLDASRRFRKPVVTEIAAAAAFFPAEEIHQDYYKRNPDRYEAYLRFSGREKFFLKAWGSPAGARPGHG